MILKYDKFNESFINDLNIKRLCYKYGIKNYKINKDGTIDVDGNVNLDYRVIKWGLITNLSPLKKLPLKFKNVSGYFNCAYNNLTSLVGSPEHVGGFFNCICNNLTSLEGAPKYIGGYINFGNAENEDESFFGNNKIKSLKGLGVIGEKMTPTRREFGVFKVIGFKDNPIEKMLNLIDNLDEKLNDIIEIFNEYYIDCNSDPEYMGQLFEDHGIRLKWIYL